MKRVVAAGLGLAMIFVMAGAGLAGLNDGLVAYYPFNGNANDESGNGNNGTLNGVTPTEDRFGSADSAYSFGTAKNIRISDSSSLDITYKITLTAWLYRNSSTGSYESVLCKGHSSALNSPYALLILNNKLHLIFNRIGGVGTGLSGSTDIPANQWVHAAATWDGTKVTFYVNGVQDIKNYDYSTVLGITDEDLIIGMDKPGTSDDCLNGKIDDVYIFNRSLSESEIQELYDGSGGTCNYTDSDNDGVIDRLDTCPNTPAGSWVNKSGCPASGLYTQEQVNKIIEAILLWGDIDGDKKISLPEAIHALQVTSGITTPAIK